MSNRLHRVASLYVAEALATLALTATGISAQQLGPLPTVAGRSDLGPVEAEARSHPQLPASHVAPLYWRENEIPGSADRRCVEVPQEGPVRSGDFTIWYNSLYRPRAGEPHKVAWAPSENSTQMALQVRAQLVGNPAAPHYVRNGLGRPAREGQAPREDEWFFPSETIFSGAGEWVVVATSGRNWGCFVFTVTEATP